MLELKDNSELRLKSNLKENANVREVMAEKEMSKLSLKDLLVASMGTQRRTRVTNSNLKCSKYFTFNNKPYHGCTLDRDPGGQIPTKEWCLVDKNPDSSITWDFCKPEINYDKIREKIQDLISKLTNTSRQVESECQKIASEEEKFTARFKTVLDVQGDLTTKLSFLYSDSLAAKNSLDYLNSVAKQWRDLESKSVGVAQQIEKVKDKIKILELEAKEEKEKEASSEVKPIKTSPEQIKLEAEMTKMQIADWIQQKNQHFSKDCQGLLNYEEESEGTGLLGKYFDNPTFSGSYKKRIDGTINLEMTGSSPIDGVNQYNYSIQWDGFVKAPYRSKFYFGIETEGGAEVHLSGKKIVSHRMYTAAKETKDRGSNILKDTIQKQKDPSNNNYNRKVSEGINLSAGDKYIIRIKYYHSVHDFMDEDIRTYVKLFWYTDEMDEEIIDKKFLYSEDNVPSFKLSGINPEIGVVRKLEENDLAFKDSKTFIIQDIPTEYRGNPSLKLASSFKMNKLEFTTNIPINVYIAKIDFYERPFPDDFENMNQFMSLLEINEPDDKDKPNLQFNAVSSSLLRIYKKKYQIGRIKIPITKSGLGAKGVPIIVFFGVDSSNTKPMACGGSELWISQPSSSHFDNCEVSSKFNNSWGCESGLRGTMQDKAGTMWATNNEGIGAFLKVSFKSLYEVTRIQYKDRATPGERNSKLEFEFSSGDTFTYDHVLSDEEVSIVFDVPFRAYWVKVTIKGVYGTINNGGSFKIFGTQCKAQTDAEETKKEVAIKPLFDLSTNKIFNLGCLESVSNSKKLFNVNKSVGKCVQVNCFNSCFDSLLASVYGTEQYSQDSAICKSAVHAGVLSTTGGKVDLCFGDRSSNLKAVKKNGIQSKFKKFTELTIKFKPVKIEEKIPNKVGTKFDLLSIDKKWQSAVVTEIIRVPIIGTQLAKYRIDGKEGILNLPAVPLKNNPLVAPCGIKVKNRDCNGSKSNEVKKINIRFGPKTMKNNGENYLLDDGSVFGSNGIPYGWSREMKENMKYFKPKVELGWEDFKSIVDSYVEFPPSKKSKFCSSSIVVCDKATYSIRTGEGKFMVRIFIQIQNSKSLVDFKVNGKIFAKSKIIEKGKRVILEGVVDSIDELVEIDPECEDNCFYSVSRMNMIQIYPFSEQKDKAQDSMPIEEGDVCSNKYKKGKDCESGSSDVLHCVFQGKNTEGASKCTGAFIKTKFPDLYEKCPEVSGMDLCVRRKYETQSECTEYCPGSCSKAGNCLGKKTSS